MGTHRFFDEEGHLVEVKVFRDGVLSATGMLDSRVAEQGPGRSLAEELRHRGRMRGIARWRLAIFYRDGRLEQEGGYRAGQWHGRWTGIADIQTPR